MDDETRALPPTDVTRVSLTAIERDGANAETGEFSAILATEGEASDGHILSMKGLEVPERMPLLLSHKADFSLPPLGSVLSPKKVNVQTKAGKLRALRVHPQVELSGEGAWPDIRRDTFMMVNSGHTTGMSIRWDTLKSTRRINLPNNHPAYVDGTKDAVRETEAYWGHFIEKSRAREGSIVTLGADVEAQIGRGATLTLMRMLEETEVEDGDTSELAAAFEEFQQARDAIAVLGVDNEALAEMLAGTRASNMVRMEYPGDGESPCSVFIPRQLRDSMRCESERLKDESREELLLTLALQREMAAKALHPIVKTEPAKVERAPINVPDPQPDVVGDALKQQALAKRAIAQVRYEVYGELP